MSEQIHVWTNLGYFRLIYVEKYYSKPSHNGEKLILVLKKKKDKKGV